MGASSIPHEELWDETSSLRTTVRRQAQQLKVQEEQLAELKATTANLTAAIGAILEYVNPERGGWVYAEDCPPEYEEYEARPKTYAEYTALLFQVPAEVARGH